ncbi:MAG: methyltransferase domain-containing protein [Cellvibrionales bacterium]|nr:methyltransferase domain-containing protein [Porticoccaceae bacterium]|tara:strand:+ start:7582 stop:8370 length:789 start_codon:yes stop_codon:yes gene_type:complete
MSDDYSDRNFDDLAEKFARKVYGGLKGEIRLAVIRRDMQAAIANITGARSLRILDVGGGLGQHSVELAQLGHRVVYSDISRVMCDAAREHARDQQVEEQIQWHCASYQHLSELIDEKFDLVMCHALIEWLAEPELLISQLRTWIDRNGWLSLTFYNRNGLDYRNLIRGNFHALERQFSVDSGSLTPQHPLTPDDVLAWFDHAGLSLCSSSGIRVFHDYVTTLRGGHADPSSILKMELKYSTKEPFKWLGRYVHLIAQPTRSN